MRYGPRIKIVEPNILELPAEIAKHGAVLTDLDEAIKHCEVAIVLVEHDQFKIVPLSERRHLAVLDMKGIWQDMPNRDLGARDFRDRPYRANCDNPDDVRSRLLWRAPFGKSPAVILLPHSGQPEHFFGAVAPPIVQSNSKA